MPVPLSLRRKRILSSRATSQWHWDRCAWLNVCWVCGWFYCCHFWKQYTWPGFAGQASSTGFMAGICRGTINLLPVHQRNAAFPLDCRSEYRAIGANLSHEEDDMKSNLWVLFSVKLALGSYCKSSITRYLHSIVWLSPHIFLTLVSSRQTLAVVWI